MIVNGSLRSTKENSQECCVISFTQSSVCHLECAQSLQRQDLLLAILSESLLISFYFLSRFISRSNLESFGIFLATVNLKASRHRFHHKTIRNSLALRDVLSRSASTF